MSNEMNTMNAMVNEAELENITGGHHHHHDEGLGKKMDAYCLQCEITGRSMTQHLYKKNGKVYCPLCGTEYPELR